MILSRLRANSGLFIVLLLYFVVAIYTNIRTPLFLGADEVAHFMFARFLREQGYLPISPEDREAAGYKSDQPPLNATLVALAYFWGDLGDPTVKLTPDSPRRQLAVITDGYVGWQEALNTEDPWAGEILFWRIGRFLSTLFAGATLVVVYIIALNIFGNEDNPRRWALSAVASLAFIPTFVLVSSVFSYESLLAFWLSLYLLAAVHIIKKPEGAWKYLVAGLFIGLGIITKLSALVAPLALVVLVLIVGYREKWSIWKQFNRLIVGGMGIIVSAGWWFALVMIRLNRVTELGWFKGLIHPIVVADGSDTTSVRLFSGNGELANTKIPSFENVQTWINEVFRTFWRFRDQGEGWETGTIFYILTIITILIMAGLVRIWWRNREARVWLFLLITQVLIFAILPLVRLILSGVGTGRGHHILFPAAGAFAVLITWGLSGLFPIKIKWRWLGGMLLGMGLLIWSVVRAVQIYNPPLPVRTVSPLMPGSVVSVDFDFDSITLTGYELKGLVDGTCCDVAYPALGLNLYWLAQEFSHYDYLTEVTLVDNQNGVQTVWLGYPANGRYPTRAWDPGDVVRDEVWLPLVGLESGEYTIMLRLLQADNLQPLNEVALATVDLQDFTKLQNADINVWQQGQIASELPLFRAWSTIQITTADDVELSLIDPNQVMRLPVMVGGHTHIFLVDPRWPKRSEYQLLVKFSNEPARQTESILIADGKGRKTEIPNSQVVVNANFANQIQLLGYNLPQQQVGPGQDIPITLNLQALQTMPADFMMFTRLYDEAGTVWGGYDRRPQEHYSTILWVADEVVEDGFTIKMDGSAPPGVYYLHVGFYLLVGQAPVSLPLVQDGQFSDVTHVQIGPINIGEVPLSQ